MEKGSRYRILTRNGIDSKRAFLRTALSILAGIIIGLLATLILRFMSGTFGS